MENIVSTSSPIIDVIIPVYNEEESIALVIQDIPETLVRHIIVCNNGSTDQTAKKAADAGAVVIDIPKKGYGRACLGGMEYISGLAVKPDIVVFLDGDYSDFPQEMQNLVQPVIEGNADLVIGSRALGNRETGSMTPQQLFGNWLATKLLFLFFKYRFTDLGPFRAIRYDSLLALKMNDPTYGWTVEMQVKAAKRSLKCVEVPVSYRKRIGESKVSGTVKGTLLAGYKILWTIVKHLT